MSTNATEPQEAPDHDAQPVHHAVCHDCDEFELVHKGSRSYIADTVRFHRAATGHDVELAEVAH